MILPMPATISPLGFVVHLVMPRREQFPAVHSALVCYVWLGEKLTKLVSSEWFMGSKKPFSIRCRQARHHPFQQNASAAMRCKTVSMQIRSPAVFLDGLTN